MRTLATMLMAAFVMAGSAALAGEQLTKEGAYKRITDAIEKAKAEIEAETPEYEKVLEPYSAARNGVAWYQRPSQNLVSCEDPQMAGIDEDMLALEIKLWEMYDELAPMKVSSQDRKHLYRAFYRSLT